MNDSSLVTTSGARAAGARLLLIAIDGLDWDLMQTLVDAGGLPCLAQLLAAGSSGRMAVPQLMGETANWATVATGVGADRHGLLHELSPRDDGMTVSATGAEALRVPALWHAAARAAWAPHVAGWPALLHRADGRPGYGGRTIGAGHWVSAGLDTAVSATADQWPLPPTSIWPAKARDEVFDALVHPSEVSEGAVAALTAALPEGARAPLAESARALLASWSSVQALGLAWAAKPDARLIALRYAGLPAWCHALWPMARRALPDALLPCYQWIDLLVGRFMHVLGRSAHLALVTDRGLPLGGYRGGQGPGESGAAGGLIVAGPTVPADALLDDARAEDVCPTLLGLMGLLDDTRTDALDGRNLLDAAARRHASGPPQHVTVEAPTWPEPPDASETLAWLAEHGVAAVDLGPLHRRVAMLRRESFARWALARRLRGALDDAIGAWRELLDDEPANLLVRVALGDALVAAGRGDECRALLDGAPPAASEAPWGDVLAGLSAFGIGDWAAAELHLGRLVDEQRTLINAPGLLGWVRLRQSDWVGALRCFEQATRWPHAGAQVWEGMGLALHGLARHEEAVVAFGRAIAYTPHQARLHARRAESLAAIGQTEKAIAGWWRALELDPGFTAAQVGLARTAIASESG